MLCHWLGGRHIVNICTSIFRLRKKQSKMKHQLKIALVLVFMSRMIFIIKNKYTCNRLSCSCIYNINMYCIIYSYWQMWVHKYSPYTCLLIVEAWWEEAPVLGYFFFSYWSIFTIILFQRYKLKSFGHGGSGGGGGGGCNG